MFLRRRSSRRNILSQGRRSSSAPAGCISHSKDDIRNPGPQLEVIPSSPRETKFHLPTSDEFSSESQLHSPFSSGLNLDSSPQAHSPQYNPTPSTATPSGDQHDLELPGKLDLTILHELSDPNLDIIFVHGLNGGSVKTWCFKGNPKLFWPRWLPEIPKLSKARVSTFGYDAGVLSTSEATDANVNSFSQKLLHCLLMHQTNTKFGTVPILFICHSMGGLVVKRAYIIAEKAPQYKQIWKKIKGIIFLGTPHRGSQQARKLNAVLHLIGRGEGKGYVRDLKIDSGFLRMLNDDFIHISTRLQLFSFYEQKETRFGSSKMMIVPHYSAILGYQHEETAPLLADHHFICKFASPNDTNFITVTNTLVQIVTRILRASLESVDAGSEVELQQIYRFLLSPEITSTEGHFYGLRRKRLKHSCEWITKKPWYIAWEEKQDSGRPQILWLHGAPGTGKSIMSTFIIDRLKEGNKICAYYFFGSGDVSRMSFERCLLSIAYQLALHNPSIRKKLTGLVNSHTRLEGCELLLVWEKIFVSILLHSHENSRLPLFIVLDAIDEADYPMDLFTLLDNLPQSSSILRLCVVSRQSHEFSQHFNSLEQKGHCITGYTISKDSTLEDISTLVTHSISNLPLADGDRLLVIQATMEKSEGNFLWVSLVMNKLTRTGFSKETVLEVLDEVPTEMGKLYFDILRKMEDLDVRSKALATWIIRWTVSCFRPLAVAELQHALSFFPPQQWVEPLDHWIGELCGSLLMVDGENKVTAVHTTARDFLHSNPVAEYAITAETHKHITLVCIRVLLNSYTNLRDGAASGTSVLRTGSHSHRKISTVTDAGSPKMTLASYALIWWTDHLVLSDGNNLDDELLTLINELLNSSKMLDWIQEVARRGDLQCLIKTAQNLNRYLARFDLSNATASQRGQLKLPSRWTVDLVRLTTEFGGILLHFPSAIQKLIPPLCPKHSAIYERFGRSFRGISLLGGTQKHWGMKLARLIPARETANSFRAVALACTRKLIAVGYEDGHISLWNSTTCQVVLELDFAELPHKLRFSTNGTQIAAAGEKRIVIWNTSTGAVTFGITLNGDDSQQIHAIYFTLDDRSLLAISKNQLSEYNILTKEVDCTFDWTQATESCSVVNPNHAPIALDLDAANKRMAVAYRGLPVTAWDIEKGELFGILKAGGNNPLPKGTRKAPAFMRRALQAYDSANAIEFSKVNDEIYVAYADGSIVKWNPYSNEQKRARHDGAYLMSCHPDGTLLATADSSGTIRIWNADSLDPAFIVETDGESVTDLTFSPDGRRLYDIRANYCSVWEPEILLRGAKVYTGTHTPTEELTPSLYLDPISITSISVSPDGLVFLVGSEDGWVTLYAVRTGKKLRNLYRHASTVSVSFLSWSNSGKLIASGDNSGRFIVYELHIEIITPVLLRARSVIGGNMYEDTTDEEGTDVENNSEKADYHVAKLEQVLSDRLSEGEAIKSMIIQPEDKRLLVVTSMADRIWDLTSNLAGGQQVYAQPLEEDRNSHYPIESSSVQSRLALNNPNNHQEAFIITSSELRILPWFGKEDVVDKSKPSNRSVISIHQPCASGNKLHSLSGSSHSQHGDSCKTCVLTVEDAKFTSDGQFLILFQEHKSFTDNKATKGIRVFRVTDIVNSSPTLASMHGLSKTARLLSDVASIGLQSSAFVTTQNPLNPRRDVQIEQFVGLVGNTVYVLTAHKSVCAWDIPVAESFSTSASKCLTAPPGSRPDSRPLAEYHDIANVGEEQDRDPSQLRINFFFPRGEEIGLITVGLGRDIILTRDKSEVEVVRRALAKEPSLI